MFSIKWRSSTSIISCSVRTSSVLAKRLGKMGPPKGCCKATSLCLSILMLWVSDIGNRSLRSLGRRPCSSRILLSNAEVSNRLRLTGTAMLCKLGHSTVHSVSAANPLFWSCSGPKRSKHSTGQVKCSISGNLRANNARAMGFHAERMSRRKDG